jgi:hypothetical protein
MQQEIPVVKMLLGDDAPQFKRITDEMALRHPEIPLHNNPAEIEM